MQQLDPTAEIEAPVDDSRAKEVAERSGDRLEESPATLSTWRLSNTTTCGKVYETERKHSSFNETNTLLEHVVVERYSMPSNFTIFFFNITIFPSPQNSFSP